MPGVSRLSAHSSRPTGLAACSRLIPREMMYGLFSAVSLQKSVRDKLEAIPVTGIYYGLCWVSLGLAVLLLTLGLWNATLADSEKGFYAMSFLLALFGSVAVQKNIHDLARFKSDEPAYEDTGAAS